MAVESVKTTTKELDEAGALLRFHCFANACFCALAPLDFPHRVPVCRPCARHSGCGHAETLPDGLFDAPPAMKSSSTQTWSRETAAQHGQRLAEETVARQLHGEAYAYREDDPQAPLGARAAAEGDGLDARQADPRPGADARGEEDVRGRGAGGEAGDPAWQGLPPRVDDEWAEGDGELRLAGRDSPPRSGRGEADGAGEQFEEAAQPRGDAAGAAPPCDRRHDARLGDDAHLRSPDYVQPGGDADAAAEAEIWGAAYESTRKILLQYAKKSLVAAMFVEGMNISQTFKQRLGKQYASSSSEWQTESEMEEEEE
jgi:hypothetical protein